MTPSEKFLSKLGLHERPEEVDNKMSDAENSRRNFLKKTTLGGLALGGFLFAPLEDTLAHCTSGVNRYSAPSDLKITDMRYATVMNTTGRCTIIRIDTNQGISGYGEVRDGADWRYAVFKK